MTALVTGASSGIGLQYATILARDYHADLLLISNQQEALERAASCLREQYGIQATALYQDLASPTAAADIFQYCRSQNIQIDVLINNAGFLLFGESLNLPVEKMSLLIHLQVLTTTELCRLFAEDMVSRQTTLPVGNKPRKGYILNTASMTAWMSMPTIACYNACKAYVLNFSKALWYELHDSGVNVCAVTPGAVDTPLYNLSPALRKWSVRLGIALPPEVLAQRALKSLFRGKKWSMPGWINYLAVPVINHLPDWLVFFILRRLRPIIKK